MKIVSYFEGIVKLGISWDEIRPASGIPHSVLVNYLQETYQFEQVGQSQIAMTTGLYLPLLAHGVCSFEGQTLGINLIEFQPNAIIVVCPHTDVSNVVADDLIDKLVVDLEFRRPLGDRTRNFRSTIVSNFDRSLLTFFKDWDRVVDKFSSLLPQNSILKPQPYTFKFGTFAQGISTDNDLVFERRFSAPEGEDWLYTQMALNTKDHEHMLEFIENTLKR